MTILDCERREAKDMNLLAGLLARLQPAGKDAGNGACLVCRQGHPSEATCCRQQSDTSCVIFKTTTVTRSVQTLPEE